MAVSLNGVPATPAPSMSRPASPSPSPAGVDSAIGPVADESGTAGWAEDAAPTAAVREPRSAALVAAPVGVGVAAAGALVLGFVLLRRRPAHRGRRTRTAGDAQA